MTLRITLALIGAALFLHGLYRCQDAHASAACQFIGGVVFLAAFV